MAQSESQRENRSRVRIVFAMTQGGRLRLLTFLYVR